MIHSFVWIMWVFSVLVLILSTRNPIYLSVILIGLLILGHQLARERNFKRWVTSNLRFVLTMVFLSTLINGLFSHVGQTVLFIIPQGWPLIGGNITLESLVYGAINGLVIGALYILFNIINLALSIKQITRMIPRAFHPIAMMVTISLTFFPTIQRRAREIKEAQMIRGSPMKKISDWLPILIPLLVTSLENAFLLAESMTARGFHKQVDFRTPLNVVSLLLGAFAVFSGWIFRLYRYPLSISVALYIIGAALILLTLIMIGRQSNITRYHHEEWKPAGIILAIIVTLYTSSFAYLAWTDRLPSLDYSPYPQMLIPAVQITGLILSVLPLAPILIKQHDNDN